MHVQHSFSILFVFSVSYLTDVYLCLHIFALILAEVLCRVCISAYMSHGFENRPFGPLFILFVYDIVDFI